MTIEQPAWHLGDKGRCCGRKPVPYTGRGTYEPRHKFCGRCNRAYDFDAGEQIGNWAWKLVRPGVFAPAYDDPQRHPWITAAPGPGQEITVVSLK